MIFVRILFTVNIIVSLFIIVYIYSKLQQPSQIYYLLIACILMPIKSLFTCLNENNNTSIHNNFNVQKNIIYISWFIIFAGFTLMIYSLIKCEWEIIGPFTILEMILYMFDFIVSNIKLKNIKNQEYEYERENNIVFSSFLYSNIVV